VSFRRLCGAGAGGVTGGVGRSSLVGGERGIAGDLGSAFACSAVLAVTTVTCSRYWRGLAPEDLEGVAQAVAFPLIVRGPLRLRSATAGEDDEPLVVPPGTYDVLARFFPKQAPGKSAAAGLRVFRLAITFHPAKALDAPKTLRLDAGA
jgi:hypothetical protein